MRAKRTAIITVPRSCWIGPFVCLLFMSCTAGDKGLRHPLYIKGVRLEKAGDYKQAIAAFEKCLRMEPGNRPAHVHLGMLYEDHTADPFAAMYHYSRACAGEAEDAHAQLAARSLERVALSFAVSRAPAEPVKPPASSTAELERLKERVEKLSEEHAALAEQLRLKQAEIDRLEREQAIPPPPTVEVNDPVAAGGEIRVETIYTVRKGDTLYRIARERYGGDATWQQLRDYNDDILHGSELLRPGMKIRIPDLKTLRKETGDGE